MEHSTAIMEDAGQAIDGAATSSTARGAQSRKSERRNSSSDGDDRRTNNYQQRKRKANFHDSNPRHGSKRGRSDDSRDNKRRQKSDMGRGQYFRDQPDKRDKINASREKQQEGNGPNYGTQFSKDEIDAEERRPKRKVAVMIGYSGTGYKGMQISPSEKTIEGDLFNAFIAAGAISKANADDPKKASLVRCARTDKGVHAAGNMISLKLIVEQGNIVEKINEHLSPQIRVWGIERTTGGFSCYQACDSRWYEYLIPSHAFLPPHPSSWLANRLEEGADEAADRAGYEARQAEVKGFWGRIDEEMIKPVLASIDEDIRFDVIKALQGEDEANAKAVSADAEVEQIVKAGRSVSGAVADEVPDVKSEKTEEAAIIINEPVLLASDEPVPQECFDNLEEEDADAGVPSEMFDSEDEVSPGELAKTNEQTSVEPSLEPSMPATATSNQTTNPLSESELERLQRLRAATKQLRNAYITAKQRYRIQEKRIDRIQDALSEFVGTANYHNYTVQKTYKDPSAKRHIKSFVVNTQPILIGEGLDEEKSEWLSLKVHGQSFMMHQIRKMVGMVTLLVRCGSDIRATMPHSLTEARYSIPKVPGLGLLLERPVFDSYNTLQAPKNGREQLDFSKYEKELEAFKQREIYQRIFREEEERNEFSKFFNHVDNFKEPYFLYVTSKGWEATKGIERKD